MKSKLQLGRVIINWEDAGFETFLETLNEFHDFLSELERKEKLLILTIHYFKTTRRAWVNHMQLLVSASRRDRK